MNNVFDIVIIGGGCAGMTAAIYARRAGKSVVLIEGQIFGGQIANSPNVENYPGFLKISGAEFSDNLLEQVKNLGGEVVFDTVKAITDNIKTKTVTTDYSSYECKAVIIAAGLQNRKTGIESEDSFVGHGISYCATCDGAFFKDKEVAVYGGGNTALQDALYLADICKKITIIHRRDKFRGDESLVKRIMSKPNIELLLDNTVVAFNGEKMLTSATAKNTKTDELTELYISGLFVAIGQIPRSEIFKGIIELDDYGFIKSDESCKTTVSGIFVAGDCRTKEIRQLTTAAADGTVSATEACKYIDLL